MDGEFGGAVTDFDALAASTSNRLRDDWIGNIDNLGSDVTTRMDVPSSRHSEVTKLA